MRAADYVFKKLAQIGISRAYLVTGRGALFLTDALAKNKEITPICTHHEQSAGYAAAAESQLTGNPSLCLVSTGCASTNCVTAVLNAWQDNLPVIFISGQHVLNETTYFTGHKLRTYGQQEANIISIVESITKYSRMVTCVEELPKIIDEAISSAITGRKGPVWIDIPLDIQSSRLSEQLIKKHKPINLRKKKFNPNNIKKLESDLKLASRPVILIGSGVRHSNTILDLKKFIETNNVPLVYSASSVDIYPSGNKLSIGSIGSMGCSREGAFALQNSDLVIILGNRMPSILTGLDFCKFARDAKVHVVDIDKFEHQKSGIKIDNFINIDLSEFFALLSKRKITKKIDPWIKTVLNWKKFFNNYQNFEKSNKLDLYDLSRLLSKKLNKDAVVITDSGFIEVILPTNINFSPSRRAIHPISQGSMGFALPAILGVHNLNKERQILCVVGDGSIMMNLQELQTISHHKIKAKIIIINNDIYSIIRRRQKELFRNRTIGTGILDGVSVPNFKKVASSFNFEYFSCNNTKNLEQQLDQFLQNPRAAILELKGRLDQKYVEIGYTKNKKGKIVRRPLEDQWPYLDREFFLKEMIVEPIDQ